MTTESGVTGNLSASPASNKPPASGAPPSTPAQSNAKTASELRAPKHTLNVGEASATVDVSAADISGLGAAHNSHVNITNNNFGQGVPGIAASWEDDLSAVSVVPEPDLPLLDDEVERHVEALHDRRLLLLCHVPHRQDDAVAAMRAVVRRLQQRHPGRPVFASSLNGGLRLESLRRESEWRQDRRNGIIYLYRSADPTAESFFEEIEKVGQLIDQLRRMNTHLVLTVRAPAVAFRDHAQLCGRISIWVFDAPLSQGAESVTPAPPAPPISGTLELAVAMCAALFPALGVTEFVELVDNLAPKSALAAAGLTAARLAPSTAGAASADDNAPQAPAAGTEDKGEADAAAPRGRIPGPASRPRSRHERWWYGERDAVLAELGVQLREPLASEGAEADSAEPGMLFIDTERRAGMASRLYADHPILLSQHLDTLMRLYLSPSASARFRAGYRRHMLRMHAIDAQQLSHEWLLRHFHESLKRSPDYAISRAYAELMLEMPDSLHNEAFIGKFFDGLADGVREQEYELIHTLNEHGALQAEAEAQGAPCHRNFWLRLMADAAVRPAIDHAASRQAITIDLLISLAVRWPSLVVDLLGKVLADCDRLYARWLETAEPVDASRAPVSLARAVFHDLQGFLLHQMPQAWLGLAEAIVDGHAPTPRATQRDANAWQTESQSNEQQRDDKAAQGRRLAYDCFFTFTSVFAQSKPRRLASMLQHALLADGARTRLGRLLTKLLQLAEPPGWREDAEAEDSAQASEAESIDIGSLIWLYKSLALAAMAQEGGTPEQAAAAVAELVAPLRTALRPTQRLALADVTRLAVDFVFAERDKIPLDMRQHDKTEQQRREATRHLQAIQMVQRALRGGAARTTA